MTRGGTGWAASAIAGLLAACNDVASQPRCPAELTCVTVEVESLYVETIDQLELDLVYAGEHGTTVIGDSATVRALPLSTAVIFDISSRSLIQVDLVAAGMLRGTVLASGAASTTVQPGHQASMIVDLDDTMPASRTCCTAAAPERCSRTESRSTSASAERSTSTRGAPRVARRTPRRAGYAWALGCATTAVRTAAVI